MADRNFNGGMWEKNTLVGAELAYFDRGGIPQVTNVTQRTSTLIYPGGIGINILNMERDRGTGPTGGEIATCIGLDSQFCYL